MKKRLMIILFFALLLLPNISFLFLKDLLPDTNNENRALAEPPNFSINNIENLPGEIEAYINDHAAFKQQVVAAYASMNYFLFDSLDSSSVIIGKDGWYFFKIEHTLEDYLGTDLFPQNTLEAAAAYLTQIKEYHESMGRTFVFFIAPNKGTIYGQYMPDTYQKVSDTSRGQQLYEYLLENTDVPVVYPKQLLRDASQINQIYYKLDTHWNYAGGFLGAQELLRHFGAEPIGLDEIEVTYVDKKQGDLTNLINLPPQYCDDTEAILQDPIYAESPMDERSVVFIHDSFGEAIKPILEEYFAELNDYHVLEFTPEEIEPHNPDVVVMEVVERNVGVLVEYLEALLD